MQGNYQLCINIYLFIDMHDDAIVQVHVDEIIKV